MSSKTERLVKDLASLFVKYSLSDWEPLLAELRYTIRHGYLAEEIERQFAEISKAKRSRAGTKRLTKTKSRLKKQVVHPDRLGELSAFHDALVSRRALPTSGDLRLGAELIGIKEDLPSDRRQAIDRILAHLASLGKEEAIAALTRVAYASAGSKQDQGAEYERWAALIMKR